MNSQDLSIFQFGFDVNAVFYYFNRYVEYFTANDVSYFASIGETVIEGTTPTDLEVYISFDYNGNNATATWTKVNDIITSRVETRDAFTGMSYPGPWNAPYFTDFKREEALQKSDGRWRRAELDLNPYVNETNFTLKFKVRSFFSEARPFRENGVDANLRSGRYIISDVFYVAHEQ